MLGSGRSRIARLVALAVMLALTAATAALAAPGGQRSTVPAQRLDAQTHQALLSLYSLDSQLHASRARVALLERAAVALEHRRVTLRHELTAAKASLRVARRELALHLRVLYQQGNVDPVAVVLGATSLGTAVRRLEDLSQMADQNRQIVVATTEAARRLVRTRVRLAAEGRRLASSLADGLRAQRTLAHASAARLAFVSALRSRERLRAGQVRNVVKTAQAVEQKAQRLQPRPPPPPATGGRRLVVSATCYDLPGTTATGMPVGHGVVAVDPSVISLGSRLYIPGYGHGVAADVGSGIRGRIIDLWFSTYAQCAAWGRRTVTITIY